MRINGAQVASATLAGGDWVTFNAGMTIGARDGSSLFGDLMIYGLLYIDRPLAAAEYARAEQYMARLAGVTLA
ncbi:hypothetical protein D2N39_12720 [Gemmobacter lutimaris]|uniref:Uncharacterized protein n=2 Tax=Gemmobacter lutimaris TaxID=2306023 RepID=A0A398BT14_9RHOB|nr:hypothetical protein D2N39_12720 [Gemmobacter lutimaris]